MDTKSNAYTKESCIFLTGFFIQNNFDVGFNITNIPVDFVIDDLVTHYNFIGRHTSDLDDFISNVELRSLKI